MDFETEEQQLEAIKSWWKDNSTMIFGGVAIGISAIFGWQYYQETSIAHTDMASVIYDQVIVNAQNPATANEQLTKVNELQGEYSDTPYAALAALVLAKQQIAAGEFTKAQQQLEWVVNNASQDELKYLSKIRLARLYLSTQQADRSLQLLSEPFPQSFNAMALELKGDVLLTQGNKDQARAAYQQALSFAEPGNRLLLDKINDTGAAETIPDDTTLTSEPSA